METTKDGPTAERRNKRDLDYLVEAGPGEKGIVGHFKARDVDTLDLLYKKGKGTISFKQYSAGIQYQYAYERSGLAGKATTMKLERVDGDLPGGTDGAEVRRLEALTEIFEIRNRIGNTKSMLLERVIGEGHQIAAAARMTTMDPVGYEQLKGRTAIRRFQDALQFLAEYWGYEKRRHTIIN